ncbi:MAG: hypothetical protein Q6353_014100, partial [Candidatus Sigynarchaeum springense]
MVDSIALSGHADGIKRVRFSSDGTMLVTCGYDCRAMLWDVASGR